MARLVAMSNILPRKHLLANKDLSTCIENSYMSCPGAKLQDGLLTRQSTGILSMVLHVQSAIHPDHLPSDIARFFRDQKRDDKCHVFRSTNSPKGNLREELACAKM